MAGDPAPLRARLTQLRAPPCLAERRAAAVAGRSRRHSPSLDVNMAGSRPKARRHTSCPRGCRELLLSVFRVHGLHRVHGGSWPPHRQQTAICCRDLNRGCAGLPPGQNGISASPTPQLGPALRCRARCCPRPAYCRRCRAASCPPWSPRPIRSDRFGQTDRRY